MCVCVCPRVRVGVRFVRVRVYVCVQPNTSGIPIKRFSSAEALR